MLTNEKPRRLRGVAALLAGSLVLSLAGCSTASEEVKLVDRPAEKPVIRMFSSGGIFSASNQAKYWSDNFAKQTGIDAVIDYNEESQYYAEEGQDARTLLRNRIESDRPDDMYIVNAEDMIEFARKGYILDMSEFDFVDNLSDTALQMSTIDGKVYCLPLVYTGYGLYWNVELLEKYGLQTPKNYGELIEVWDALTKQGITPYAGNKGYALTVPVMCMSLAKVYQSEERDQLLAELAEGTTPVSTYVRPGFELLAMMCEKGYINPKEAVETNPKSEEEIARFINGESACVCATMSTNVYCDSEKTGFEVRMTGWPTLEDGCVAVVGTDRKLCANPKSEYLDIVTAFIETAGTEQALKQCTEDGQVSSGKHNDPSKYRENEKEFDELIQSAGQIPNTDMNLKLNLWEHIRDISRLILTGEATVDEACRMLDETQKQDIADNAAAR